ncbi:MAG: ribonuclease P protein component [Pseudomonadota bacterium]
MIGRILRPADFERVLATAPRARSAHFAVHHLSGSPSRAREVMASANPPALVPLVSPDLSTAPEITSAALVDESSRAATQPLPGGHWLGLVVPKRHAKRAVTRNLIKRQIRAAMRQLASALPPGLWVVRLRQGFDRQQFTSPASEQLQAVVRGEIALLFERALAPRAPSAPRPVTSRVP